MKSFTITVPDNKENLFSENIQIASDNEIPNEHKKIVGNRMKRMKDQPESCLSWEDIEKQIKI
jgi:hypothetical protein